MYILYFHSSLLINCFLEPKSLFKISIYGKSMEIQKEIQIICGTLRIQNLPSFLKAVNSIASENEVIIQGLNADLFAGERHLNFAVGKALRAINAGRNIAKNPGIEIMRYAAGERQIDRSFSIGLCEGKNNAVFVLLGEMDHLILASSAIRKMIEEKPCSELLAYSDSKKEGSFHYSK